MAELFKIGDIVQLKSGGPKMTIREYTSTDENYVSCQWFAGNKLESGAFPTESLILVEPFKPLEISRG